MADWISLDDYPDDLILGQMYLCWNPKWDRPANLMYKTNQRFINEKKVNGKEVRQPYFGDPIELDDYEMAEIENFPTHLLIYIEPPGFEKESSDA